MNLVRLKEIPSPAPIQDAVFVYILASPTGAYYIGSAKDISRRIQLHRSGRGSKFTSDNQVEKLVYVEGPFDLKTAVQREFQLKRWSRAKKEALVFGHHAALRQLARSRDG